MIILTVIGGVVVFIIACIVLILILGSLLEAWNWLVQLAKDIYWDR